jgi:hypothetical protein
MLEAATVAVLIGMLVPPSTLSQGFLDHVIRWMPCVVGVAWASFCIRQLRRRSPPTSVWIVGDKIEFQFGSEAYASEFRAQNPGAVTAG